MRLAMAVCVFVICGVPAGATVPDYCAAYARDFADAKAQQPDVWKAKYGDAETACLAQYADAREPLSKPAKVVAQAKPKPKLPVAKKPAVIAPTAALPESKPVVEGVKAAAVAAAPKLEEGSAEWLDYCSRKYVSFNPTTKTYLSQTGVVRKCLVTADFK